jgi:hypothetical protein
VTNTKAVAWRNVTAGKTVKEYFRINTLKYVFLLLLLSFCTIFQKNNSEGFLRREGM